MALFQTANSFHLGAYQAAVNAGLDAQGLSDADAIERDFFVHRAYVAMGQSSMVLAELSDDSPTALQGVRLLARYKGGEDKEGVLSSLSELLSDPMTSSNPMLAVMAATLYMCEGDFDEALKACSACTSLEMHAMMINAYLKLERADLAERQLKAMQGVDDDATLTQLCTAWVNVGLGGLKVQEAFYVFQELGDKFEWTARLYNGSAACNMVMGRFEEAEKDLMEALSKDSKDPETLANLVTVNLHLGKPAASRYLTQLKAADAAHPLAARLASAEEMFDRTITNMAS